MQLHREGQRIRDAGAELYVIGNGSPSFIDGFRDQGSQFRDPFNIEQVEIVKGPSGADKIGRGHKGAEWDSKISSAM